MLGIICGVVGGAFAWCLRKTKAVLAKRITNPVVRIAVVGAALSVMLLLLHGGRYAGLGTNLINAGLYGEKVFAYDWILKFVFTVVTLSAGFQGGEVTPLFSIGTALGAVLGGLFGLPVTLTAALGYAAVFGSASNTFLAPVMIGAEIFGFSYLPCFFTVCAAAYMFNFNQSIYTKQRMAGDL